MDFNSNSYTQVFYPRDFCEMDPITVRGPHQEVLLTVLDPLFGGQKMGDPITQKLADGLLQNQIHIYNLTQALLRTWSYYVRDPPQGPVTPLI